MRFNKASWPSLIKLVEHTLNHRPQRRLGGHAPVTVMTGLPADNPLDTIFYNPQTLTISSVEITTDDILKAVEQTQSSLMTMHKDVLSTTNHERESQRATLSRN